MDSTRVRLVSSLAVGESWRSFATTTALPRFLSAKGRQSIGGQREETQFSVQLAHQAGVTIATGTDFGGWSLPASQLAWGIESLVAVGLAPCDAIEAAPASGGELLGEPDAACICEGGPADFILIHGDPLPDPSAMWGVWRVSW